MSLDTVELVMRVEETFDVTIPEREAEKIVTVGDLYRYVVARVQLSDAAGCLSSGQFYRLRRALMESTGVARERVRPATSVDDLIPLDGRREHWERLGQILGLKLPRLLRPITLWKAFADFVLVSAVVGFPVLVIGLRVKPESVAAASLIGYPIALIAWFRFTRKYAVILPRSCQTVRGLVETLLGREDSHMIPEGRKWSRATVWEAIRAIVVAQASVSPDVITEDTSFVYDLGLD